MPQFNLGFWNYPAASRTTLDSVDDWKDLGMNLTLSPRYDPDCSKQHFLDILNKGHQNGIRYILNDGRAGWGALTGGGEAAYRAGFSAMVEDFGSHPAVWGYYVGDEPNASQFKDACRACSIGKELAPGLKAFINMLPWFEGVEKHIGIDSFPDYLDELVRHTGIEFFSYDCYAQMNPGKSGWPMYFQNLRYYSEAAARNGIPFWTTLLSCGHFRYRVPGLDDFRWQINTAAACGAKGLWWFVLYKNDYGFSNYRRAPIYLGRKTQTYEDLWEAQTTFKNFFADTLAELELKKVQFTRETYGGFPLFTGDDVIARPEGKDFREYDDAMIFSYFTDKAGRNYVMVVNNSCTDSIHPTLYLKGEDRRVFLYFYGNEERELRKGVSLHDNGMFESKDGHTLLPQWLAPGQALFFRWE